MQTNLLTQTSTKLELRPYQQECIDNVLAAISRGERQTLVISPTSSGKTVCFIKIAEELLSKAEPDEVVLILSHLDLLTSQTKKKFNKFSQLEVGILQGKSVPSVNDRVVISTIQSSRDFTKIATYYEITGKKVRYIITDEAHLRWSKSYSIVYNTFPDAQLIDVTATPFKNKRLAVNVYDSVSFQISLQELIDRKYIVQPVLKQIIVDGDTTEKRCAMFLRTYLEFEKGKKAIMFMRSKAECKLLADALVQENIKAAIVTDDVKGTKREKIFEQYDTPEMDVLISVNVLTAGFDALLCESVFMYETASPVVYMQRLGRAIRPQDGLSVKPEHTKQTARIYYFGDLPTIESGEIEKLHNQILKPKKYDDCESIEEKLEYLEDNDLADTEEHKFCKAALMVQKIAKKISMPILSKLIEEKAIPAQFMERLASIADSFKPIQGGNNPASYEQLVKMQSLGLSPQDGMTSTEASYVIQAMSGNKMSHHNTDNRYVLTSGKFAGSHIKDLKWAYKMMVLKKYPGSPIAKLIREFHPRAK